MKTSLLENLLPIRRHSTQSAAQSAFDRASQQSASDPDSGLPGVIRSIMQSDDGTDITEPEGSVHLSCIRIRSIMQSDDGTDITPF